LVKKLENELKKVEPKNELNKLNQILEKFKNDAEKIANFGMVESEEGNLFLLKYYYAQLRQAELLKKVDIEKTYNDWIYCAVKLSEFAPRYQAEASFQLGEYLLTEAGKKNFTPNPKYPEKDVNAHLARYFSEVLNDANASPELREKTRRII